MLCLFKRINKVKGIAYILSILIFALILKSGVVSNVSESEIGEEAIEEVILISSTNELKSEEDFVDDKNPNSVAPSAWFIVSTYNFSIQLNRELYLLYCNLKIPALC